MYPFFGCASISIAEPDSLLQKTAVITVSGLDIVSNFWRQGAMWIDACLA